MPPNDKPLAIDLTVRVNKLKMENYLQRAKIRVFDALSWWVEEAAERSGDMLSSAIKQETPVDTSALQMSTDVRMWWTRGKVRPGVRVQFVQTATNRNNEYYGKFLISGFHTSMWGHVVPGPWIPANDYPLRAYQNVYGDLREMLKLTGSLAWSGGWSRPGAPGVGVKRR